MNRNQLLAIAVFFASASALAGEAPIVPNLEITPGVARTDLSVAAICKTKWGKDARHVTDAMKAQVFKSYGLSGNSDPACKPAPGSKQRCEIDHLVSRELGGADDVKNLWPQPYAGTWNAHLKDKLENRLHKEMCAGKITLQEAQSSLVNDWRVAYRKYYGEPK